MLCEGLVPTAVQVVFDDHDLRSCRLAWKRSRKDRPVEAETSCGEPDLIAPVRVRLVQGESADIPNAPLYLERAAGVFLALGQSGGVAAVARARSLAFVHLATGEFVLVRIGAGKGIRILQRFWVTNMNVAAGPGGPNPFELSLCSA